MPGGDRTGPSGMGPRTGRAAGFCADYPAPGYANPFPSGFGMGQGFGRGRGGNRRGFFGGGYGWNWGYPSYEPSPVQELDLLQNQAKALQKQLTDIQSRISELEADSKTEGK